jgi:hypothetical protein
VAAKSIAVACGLTALLHVADPVRAGAVDFSGTYRLLPSQSDDLDSAIERAVQPMRFVVRPFARRRLRKINTPYSRITIRTTVDDVVFVGDPRAPIDTPVNGPPIDWKREDGEPFSVSAVWDGGVLQQTFVSGTGRRVNRYTLSPDGRLLTMRVAVSGGGLPGTLAYTLVYQRVA